MYRVFRATYRALDRALFSRMSLQKQLALKAGVLRVARGMFPERIQAAHASQLVDMSGSLSSDRPWQPPALPAWVKDELRALAAIDPELHPENEAIARASFYSAPWCYDQPGQVYAQLWHSVERPVDVAIAVPWLKTGGADLGAVHVANALAEDLDRRVLVMATEDQDSPWASRLSAKVQFLPIGRPLAPLAPGHRLDVLVRLLLQLSPRVFHIMNSRLGWDAVVRNGLALRQHMRIFASLYCDDFTPHGVPVGYARSYLPRCYTMLDGILSDNTRTWRAWVQTMGVPASLFNVLPFPAPATAAPTTRGAGKAILWAGRLDRQKRPDLLARIAAAMPDFRFDVHGTSVCEQGDLDMLRKLPNVVMHGAYACFDDVVKDDHLALLYTTAWDGMPNVLLEAAAAGLPVVAPDVGGITDFIPAADLVASADDVPAYVKSIRDLSENPALRAARVESLRIKLAERRWEVFVRRLAGIEGYVA